MNIDDLTVGQAKELAGMFGGKDDKSLTDDLIGKYAIVRSRNEGINAGIVLAADNTGVILGDARRIWYHKPKDKSVSWYEGVAKSGLDDSSKISTPASKKAIIEDYSITLCTDIATKSITEMVAYACEQG